MRWPSTKGLQTLKPAGIRKSAADLAYRGFHTGLGLFGHFKLLELYNYDRKPHLSFLP